MDKKPKSITFYILWPNNTQEHCEREMNQIGVEYYKKVYKNGNSGVFNWKVGFMKKDGYKYLEKAIVEGRVDVLENTKIFNSNGNEFTIEQLFDRINKSSN